MTGTNGKSQGKEVPNEGNVVELHGSAPKDTQKAVTDFIRDHPALVVAGGVALGVLAAALLPKGTGRKLAHRAAGLAEVAGSAGMLLGKRVRHTAEATGASLREHGGEFADRLEKLGGNASDRLGHFGSSAATRAEKLITPVEQAASKAGRSAVRKANELKSWVRS